MVAREDMQVATRGTTPIPFPANVMASCKSTIGLLTISCARWEACNTHSIVDGLGLLDADNVLRGGLEVWHVSARVLCSFNCN